MNVSKTIDLLRIVAEDIEPVSNARLAAAILYRNRIISIGFNQMKSHPFAAEYCKNPDAIFLHAETDAIFKAKKKLTEKEMSKSTLVVVRVKSDARGNKIFGIAKPCFGCESCISDYNIKTLIYTLDSKYESLCYVTKERNC